MYVFSHLHKAAGTTVNHILRRTFGLRHLDVKPRVGRLFSEDDLVYDSTKFIKPVSIAGHCLRPHIDYGRFESEMEWYTIIRDPLSRCVSHYQHQVQKMNKRLSFLEWISNGHYRNWMVYFYGGCDSLQKAIDSLHAKDMRIIDISLSLEESMQRLFSGYLQWIEAVKNPAVNNRIKREIHSSDTMMSELRKANERDTELFQYMKKLKNTTPLKVPSVRSLPPRLNTSLSFLYRNLLYKMLKGN